MWKPWSAKIDEPAIAWPSRPAPIERDVVLARRAQDAADLGDQRVDVVADAALAELAEGREVAPDLRRVDVRVLGDVLRRDGAATHLLGLRQHLQVARETRRNADRETFAHWGTPAIRRGRSGRSKPPADRARISSRLSRNAASGARNAVSRTGLGAASLCERHRALQRPGGNRLRERDLAVDDDHRKVDAVAPLELVVAVDRDAPELGIRGAAPRARAAPARARRARSRRPRRARPRPRHRALSRRR